MNSINDNTLIDIISHLDAISIIRFLSVSKHFWQHRTNPQIITRIQPYQNIIKYEQWSEGAVKAVKKNHFAQFLFFAERADDVFLWTSCVRAAAFRGNRKIVDYIIDVMDRSHFAEAVLPAARGGYKEYVDELIQRYGDFEQLPHDAIIEAALCGHLDLIQFLHEKYPEHVSRRIGWSAVLQKAAKGGHKNIIDYILQMEDPHPSTWEEALYDAIEGGHMDIVKFCMDKGAKITDQLQALVRAASSGSIEMANWVISQGARDWDEALEYAVEYGHQEMVELLVKKGARRMDRGLRMAAMTGNMNLVKYFLQRGAIDIHTALVVATKSDKYEVVESLFQEASRKYKKNMQWFSAGQYEEDEEIESPANVGLLAACETPKIGLIRYFLSKGATKLDWPLMDVIRSSTKLDPVKLLVEAGAKIPEDVFDYTEDKPELEEYLKAQIEASKNKKKKKKKQNKKKKKSDSKR